MRYIHVFHVRVPVNRATTLTPADQRGWGYAMTEANSFFSPRDTQPKGKWHRCPETTGPDDNGATYIHYHWVAEGEEPPQKAGRF